VLPGARSVSILFSFRLSHFHKCIMGVTNSILSWLYVIIMKVYEFLWDQFADWYIEISKTRLYEGAGGGGEQEAKAARRVLVYILDTSLRLLHPYMPYVTEQLWHHIPRAPKKEDQAAHALMLADWPQIDDASPLVTSDESVSHFESLQALTRSIRNARAEYNVEPGKRISATVVASGVLREEIAAEIKSIVALAKLDPDQTFVFVAGSDEAKAASGEDVVQLVIQDGVEVYLPLSGLIDPEKERLRLERQKEKLSKEIVKLAGRLQSKGFTDKAPAAVVEKARGELSELEDQASKIEASLAALP
jgi:valyl-tRNA synthetase